MATAETSAPAPLPEAKAVEIGKPLDAKAAAETGVPAPLPEAKAAHIYVVADPGGFVGAFLSRDEVAHRVLKVYPGMSFVMYVWPLSAAHPADEVIIVPYQPNNAVAFVSNDLDRCREVHRALVAVALSYDDDEADFWRHPVGVLCAPAKKRLDNIKKGAQEYAGAANAGAANAGAAPAAEEALFALINEPLERLARETERITILEDVVPVAVTEPAATP